MYEEYLPPAGKEFGPPVESYPGLKLRRLKSGTIKWYLDLKLGGKAPKRPCLDTEEGPWPGPIELAQREYWLAVGDSRTFEKKGKCNEVFESFLAQIANVETRKKYRTAWTNDIQPEIGNRQVVAVDDSDVMRVINKAATRVSERTGELLSESSLYNIRMAMTSFFTWATKVPHRYRETNPVKQIDDKELPQLPAAKEFDGNGEQMILTEQEIDRLAAHVAVPARSNSVASHMLALQLELYVQVGPEICPRISEFFALKLGDYEKPLARAGQQVPATIFFQHQINRYRKKADPDSYTKGLKSSGATSSKKRKVACSAYAQRKLDAYIAIGRREGWLHDGSWLCPQENGLPRNPGYVSKRLKQAVDKLGFDKKVTSHIFRHTWASNALDQGHDTTLIAEVLGNSKEMADTVYAHRVQRTAHDLKVASVGRS